MKKRELSNEVKITFPSLSVNEATSRSFAALFVCQSNPTIEELADIKCAVSEAVTNCIVHAYRNTSGVITLHIRVYSDRTVEIEVRDKGCGIENIDKALEPLYTSDPENERSGMGFSIMENFMDTLKVKSKPGDGTYIVMTKKLSPIISTAKQKLQENAV